MKVLERHKKTLERALGEKLVIHGAEGRRPNFRDLDNAFCVALFRRGYSREEVREKFLSFGSKHAYLPYMPAEKRSTYVEWLLNRSEREYRAILEVERQRPKASKIKFRR